MVQSQGSLEMTVFINPAKSADECTTLSKDFVGASVQIQWEKCFAEKTEKSVLLYGVASSVKGVVNFKDKDWKFEPGLLMVSMPLQPYTYKDKTTEVAQVTKLFAKFIDDGLLGTQAFVGLTNLDDCSEKFIELLLTEDKDTPINPVKKECYVQAFLDGIIDETVVNEIKDKLPKEQGYSKGSYKRITASEKTTEFLALLKSQFPTIFTDETAKNLETVFEIAADSEPMLRIIIAIMGMI